MDLQTAVPTNNLPHAARNANTLSSKVTSILSKSFSDAEFREALSLLDERAINNDPRTRRQIRLDFHKEVLDCNGMIIDEFGSVAEQLDRVKLLLDRINLDYNVMESRVDTAQKSTSTPLVNTSSILEKHREIALKQKLLSKFREQFLMTEEEELALTSTAEPVDDRFFKALMKAKGVTKGCEVLLGLENQRLGLDLMEKTSREINFGFQKLHKWVQKEFKTLNFENPQIGHRVRQALRILADRPTLFQICLDSLSEARERLLSEAFHAALTGVAPPSAEKSSVKPIDVTAHDALRYVGDMMAWVHSTAVSEQEALEVLFVAKGEELIRGLHAGRKNEVWHLISDEDDKEGGDDFDVRKILSGLVDQSMSGVSKLLRQRIEQVIRTNEESVPAYKLATLLNFYAVTFEKLLGSTSNVRSSVQSLEREALHQFRSLMKDNLAAVQRDFDAQIPPDLAPPIFFVNALEQLNAIMHTYDTSLSSSANSDSDFEGVMVDAFDPFLSGCENMSKRLSPLNASIFTLNFYLTAEHCLTAFSFTKSRIIRIQSTIKCEARQLVEKQYEFFRRQSGLDPELIYKDEKGVTTVVTSLDREILGRASQRLDEFLPTALMDASDRIKHIRDPDLARRITDEAAEVFCQDFERLEQEISLRDIGAETSANMSLHAAFPRTSAEIRVLLS